MPRSHLLIGLGAFALLWASLLPTRLAQDPTLTFADDAGQYSALAEHMVTDHMYSLDGVTPFFEREPGESLFLAGLYAMFGLRNRIAIFAGHAVVLFLAITLFATELRRHTSVRIATIAFALLLLSPSLYHVIFTPMREALALSLALVFATFSLRLLRRARWADAISAGAALGGLALTYATFILFPLFLVPFFFWRGVRVSHIVATCVMFGVVLAPWGIRNMQHTGRLCLTGCTRSALQWYVRGEQAEHLRGLEPFRCLIAEYVTRDRTGRSSDCNFNAVMHRKWPDGFRGTAADQAIGVAGQKKILAHFPNHLWISVAEVIELHLPFVNGWGFVYNLLATLGTAIVLLGVLCSLPLWRTVAWQFMALFMIYNTGLFALTDALPRYLMPILFCYTTLAGLGYDLLLRHLWRRP